MFELLVLHNRVPQNAVASNNHFAVTRDWEIQEDCFCPVMPGVSAGDTQARGGGGGMGVSPQLGAGSTWRQLLTLTLTAVNAAVCRGLSAHWPEPHEQSPHMAWASSQHGSPPSKANLGPRAAGLQRQGTVPETRRSRTTLSDALGKLGEGAPPPPNAYQHVPRARAWRLPVKGSSGGDHWDMSKTPLLNVSHLS